MRRMSLVNRLFVPILVSIGMLGGWLPSAQPAQAADLEALLRLHYQAVNRGDIPAALASFTDDAVVIRGNCSPLLPCTSNAEIQRLLQTEVGNKVSFGLLSSSVSGNTVTARLEFWNVLVPATGAQRVIYNATATFQGDKIARMVHDTDLSDPQSVLWNNFLRVVNVTNGQNTAIGRGDGVAALAFFADDAVWAGGPLCTQVACTGKQAIQQELARQIADHTTITGVSGTARVSGNVRTGRLEIRADSIRAAGVERILVDSTTEVQGDKITSRRDVPITADPQTAAYLAAQSPAPAPAPALLPAAGDVPPALPWTAAGGVLMLLAGFVLRRAGMV